MSNKNKTDQSKKNYHAFLVRLWREDERSEWRGSVENPHSGERRGFASLPSMLSFLSQRVGRSIRTDDVDNSF